MSRSRPKRSAQSRLVAAAVAVSLSTGIAAPVANAQQSRPSSSGPGVSLSSVPDQRFIQGILTLLLPTLGLTLLALLLPSISESSSNRIGAGAPLPDKPGELMARKRAGGSKGERIRYSTTNERGEIVPVTGAVFETKNPKGTVVVAPGTRGMGDQCAPSAGSSMLGGVSGSSVNVNYEAPFVEKLRRAGYRVVVTDYIGMGTPGAHTYLNRVDQGHAVIDAARAVTPAGEKVLFYGYSQGGGATAAAAELHPTYAPELNVVGTFSGAPPADPLAVLQQGNRSLEGVTAFVIASYSYSYPEFAAAVGEHATADALRYIDAVSHACVGEGAMSSASFGDLSRTDTTTIELAENDPRIRDVLELNKLGKVALETPMLVIASPQDTLVPYPQAEQMARDYCALGSDIEFRAVTVADHWAKAGVSHIVPVISESDDVLAWINDRFDGKPTTKACPA